MNKLKRRKYNDKLVVEKVWIIRAIPEKFLLLIRKITRYLVKDIKLQVMIYGLKKMLLKVLGVWF